MRRIFLLSICSAFILGACQKNDVSVKMRVHVKNSQNQPVNSATIKVNGKLLGKTDANGFYIADTVLTANENYKIEIVFAGEDGE